MRAFELKTDLHPFDNSSSELRTRACVLIKHMGILKIDYTVSGQLEKLILPPPNSTSSRADNLWKHTCFEFFVSPRGSSEYIEFNFSPSGDWNLYHFTAERVGMERFGEDNWVRVFSKLNPESFDLQATLEWEAILTRLKWPATLEASTTAVIETSEGLSYWASQHTRATFDFHARESFVHTLESPKDEMWPRKTA